MNKPSRKIIPTLLLLAFALIFAQVAQSDHHEVVETPAVVEGFRCDFTGNNDAKDLDSAVSFWQSQMEKIDSPDLKNYFAAVLTPIRSNNTADFYWLGAHANLNAFARGNAAYMASEAGQAANARFQKISTCVSNLFFSENLYQGTPPQEGDNDFVLEAYGCTLKHGKTMANVQAAEAGIVGVLKAQGSKINVFRWTPFLSGLPADVVYLVAHDDLIVFGSSNTKFFMSPGGQSSQFALSTVMDCTGALYSGEVIHAPPPDTEM
ncbi:MAG: hypothetical protein O6945_02680 [Gammaproteobacteria bacterium]|nr:hypothetical protein [Gammaproteobacteria bacterium]